MSKSDERSVYLREWRKGLWEQIRQKENAIWQFISFYAAGIVFLFGLIRVSEDSTFQLNSTTALVIALVNLFISLWGLMIVLDANFWMSRNLIFVGNIEKELLELKDFGVLLPQYYSELPNFRYEKSYTTHVFIFLTSVMLSVFLMAASVSANLTEVDSSLASIFALMFAIGLLVLFYKDYALVKEFYKTREDAPGKLIGKPTPATKAIDVLLGSPVTIWGTLLAGVGCAFLLLLASKNGGWEFLGLSCVQLFATILLPAAGCGSVLGVGLSKVVSVFFSKQPWLQAFSRGLLYVSWIAVWLSLLLTGAAWAYIGLNLLY